VRDTKKKGKGKNMNQDDSFSIVEPGAVGINPDSLQNVLSFITNEIASGTIPGAALAATRDGKLFIGQTWGTYANTEGTGKLFDTSVLNMFYSFTKVITATIVVMAQQDGLLDYDTPISHYIPGFTGGGKEPITLRHLLTHSAGIPNAPIMPVYTGEQWEQAVAALCTCNTEWQPGSRTYYHGASGMMLAAEVVRRVSGNKPWNDIVHQRLLDPLGMRDTYFTFPPAEKKVALTPQPKTFPCPLDTEHFAFFGHPAGGAVGTVQDMLRLLNLHLNKGSWKGKTLIQPGAFADMHRVQYEKEISAALKAGRTPDHEYWALGWLTRGDTQEGWFGFGNVASEQSFGHAGIDTVIGIADPQRDLALAFVTTASPATAETTVRLRNTVTNLVMKSVS
jgi:CubicO group peptidase (beta-lactamase class C family)